MGVREIPVDEITQVVRRLCIEANTVLGDDVLAALETSLALEESPVGQDVFRQLIRNAEIARTEGIPLCQDTGMVVVFLEIGQEVHLTRGDLETAVNEGVRQGYRDGHLRASTLDPLTRKNSGDNTPAVIHTNIVPADGGTKSNHEHIVELVANVVTPGVLDAVEMFVEPTLQNATAGHRGPVSGELYTFNDPEMRLSAINRLEGFHPRGPSL